MAWFDGQVTGPTAGQVIVSTGAIPTTIASPFVAFVHSTSPATFEIQHLDTNGNIVNRQRCSVVSGQTDVHLDGLNAFFFAGDSLQIVSVVALPLVPVGASIFF